MAVVLGLFVGCSSGTKLDQEARASGTLQEVHDLLHLSGVGHPPSKLADLDRHRGMFPRAYEAVKSGDVVVLWGTPLQGEGDVGKDEAVVAYEKAVPTAGGYVLLSAGTVKKMTAAEFNAAPKAGKK
jgi:hypothetical protein